MTAADVRAALLSRVEIALLDVREEDPYAQAHPLWAANLPLSQLELQAYSRLPRRDVQIAVYEDGEGLAPRAAAVLRKLGYTQVFLLDGGLAAWRAAGLEIFRDVNVPSKAFGELVESTRHTPSLSAEEVEDLLNSRADVVVLDARRFDEYQTMSIPGATSVPGAELVLRARHLAPNSGTRIIVNCAGRTRSIIGTQSLINAGIPNPVAALRNGTIGWTLAGKKLAHGQSRRFSDGPAVTAQMRVSMMKSAEEVALRAGVARIGPERLDEWRADSSRTLYQFDVRDPIEFAAGHRRGFRSAPGGQLVQETDVYAPVRGARIVLTDDDGVRANMSASWLAQMGWQVAVLNASARPTEDSAEFCTGDWVPPVPDPGSVEEVSPDELSDWIASGGVTLLDLQASRDYVGCHIPGARWILRSELAARLEQLAGKGEIVLTSACGLLAKFAARDLAESGARRVRVLAGGNDAWFGAGLASEAGATYLMSDAIDRYRRPYEGTDNPRAAMQAYLNWEFGLVAQLARDGSHFFTVL